MGSLDYEVTSVMFKPCPFCGEGVNVFTVPDEQYGEAWVLECKTCACMARRSLPYRTVEGLQEDWNRRS